MYNEDDQENENIHDNNDPQLDNTNKKLQPILLPEPTVEANDIRHSTCVHSKPQRLITSHDGRKFYDSTTSKTILKQRYVDLVGLDDHLDSDYTPVSHHVMTQFSMKMGLKRF